MSSNNEIIHRSTGSKDNDVKELLPNPVFDGIGYPYIFTTNSPDLISGVPTSHYYDKIMMAPDAKSATRWGVRWDDDTKAAMLILLAHNPCRDRLHISAAYWRKMLERLNLSHDEAFNATFHPKVTLLAKYFWRVAQKGGALLCESKERGSPCAWIDDIVRQELTRVETAKKWISRVQASIEAKKENQPQPHQGKVTSGVDQLQPHQGKVTSGVQTSQDSPWGWGSRSNNDNRDGGHIALLQTHMENLTLGPDKAKADRDTVDSRSSRAADYHRGSHAPPVALDSHTSEVKGKSCEPGTTTVKGEVDGLINHERIHDAARSVPDEPVPFPPRGLGSSRWAS